MDFDLSDDQRLLKDSVDRLVADTYGFEQRRQTMASAEGWSRATWAQFADLGLLGVNFEEEYGGFGGGPVETMLVAEAFGRGLVVEPYFATVVLGGGLLRHAGAAEEQAAYLPRIASGELLFAFAHHERAARYNLSHVGTTATKTSHGDCADKVIVSARVSGGLTDPGGIGLFVVRAEHLARRGYPTQDGQRAAEISFVAAPVIAVLTLDGFAAIARTIDEAIAFTCAEAVGAMSEMHAITIDYLKTRKQFGRAIGEFQVLQHRAVDMLVELELARSMAMYATMMSGEPDALERGKAVSAAKVQVGTSSKKLAEEAIQLHGGIAMTMEYKVGHYFKRVTMIDKQFGDVETHTARLVAAGGAL